MNYGVMAHEFSHAIFDYKFAGQDASLYSTTNLQSKTRLRAINEGVADYFSFMVTQRIEEFGESLETLKKFRTLPVAWRLSNVNQSGCLSVAYCEGSLLASALYEISTSEGQTAVNVGKVIYAALSDLRLDWQNYADDGVFDYYHFINRILDKAGNVESTKSIYCEKFKKYFDLNAITGKLSRC